MTLLPILIYGDPCLWRKAEPVGTVTAEVCALAERMIETMYAAPGRGLAAPQVGQSLRLFVVDCQWKDTGIREPLVMVDPEVMARSMDMATGEEGCLSIPGLPMQVTRPASVRVAWTGLDGARREGEFAGIEAVCIQHEHDHLEGVLITDHQSAEDLERLGPELRRLADGGGAA